jgi:caffeoyl-CoA O-methyltransferase
MADPASRAGQSYADPGILDYVARVHAPHDSALEHAFTAPARMGLPAIQVGPSEGRALFVLLRLAGATRAVEVGTLAGYSSIWLARALGPGGRLWTIESEPAHAAVARENLARAGVADRVEVRVGVAKSILPDLVAHGPFDAVFLDADKAGYVDYGRWATANLRPGGLLLADNAYFFGRLLADDEDAHRVRTFHEETREHYDSVCLGTPDGLLVGIRKSSD